MSVGLQRASVFAIKEETTTGTLIAPDSATLFLPLQPGFSMEYAAEELKSEELLNDIGASKSAKGKESVNGSHPAYARHSGVEGQEPQIGLLYESCLGAKSVAATEYNTVASSTTKIVKVDAGEGATFEVGEAILVKDATNGYSIRNIKSISTDDLTVNFDLPGAPGTGINLGKAILYKPAASGEPSFSAWAYRGNGYLTEAAAGCKVTELSVEMGANQYGKTSFSYQGTKYYFNPIEITNSSKYLDVTDDGGTFAVSIATGFYRTPSDVAEALQVALEAASAETYTVTYSNSTGKFTIASGSTTLSLLWNSGTNAANSIGTKLGFSVAANDTGALTYTSDNAQTYAASYTPSYDAGDIIVVKDAEFYIGTQDMTICQCAQTATLTISKAVEDVDCICEETGTKEKIFTSREVTLEADIIIEKHEQQLFEYLKNNDSVSAMINIGPKSDGNWIAAQCMNVYLGNAVVSSFSISGDNVITASVTVKGFITSSLKDVYVNFI